MNSTSMSKASTGKVSNYPKSDALAHNSKQVEQSRSYTVDIFRLLGAFAVVVLHTITSADAPPAVYIFLKNSARWAVPFFFLVGGYFFETSISAHPEYALLKRMKNLTGIFITANIIYFVFNLYKGSPIANTFSIQAIVTGNYFHLWFIGSMILGYLVLWFVLEQKPRTKTLFTLVGIFLILVTGLGSYAKFIGLEGLGLTFSRHLISIPLLLAGYLCARCNILSHITLKTSFFLVAFGIAIQLIEAYVIYKLLDLNPAKHDFLFGTFLFAFGMFCISMKIKTPNDNLLTRLGKEYSLLLYLYHPIVYTILLHDLPYLHFLDGDYQLFWLKPLIIILSCIFLIGLIEKKFPYMYRFISGNSWK